MTKSKKIVTKLIWYVLMIGMTVLMVYPFVFSLLGGFNTNTEFSDMGELLPIPADPTLQNFRFVFSASALRPLINSLCRSAWYAILVSLMAVLMGYVLARYDFKGKKFMMGFIVVSQVIPAVLTIIPTFVMVSNIPLVGGNDILGRGGSGLYNNPLMLYLPLSWGNLMWVFLFTQSMKSLPSAFEEAAEIDGCGFFRTLIDVVLPMQKPILTVIFVNVALNTWNDWMMPFLYINETRNSTLTAYVATLTTSLKQFGEKNYPKIFALATIAILPPLLIFLYFQKYIVQGIASAGVKE